MHLPPSSNCTGNWGQAIQADLSCCNLDIKAANVNLAHVFNEDFDQYLLKHAEKTPESFFRNKSIKFLFVMQSGAEKYIPSPCVNHCQPL